MMRVLTALIAALLFSGGLGLSAPPASAQVTPGNGSYLANALSTTVKLVKAAGPANVVWIQCLNPDATHVAYVQIFDVASATSVTLGTTVPKLSIGFNAASSWTVPMDNAFYNGIKIAATATATGSGAPTTALDCNLGFQ